MALKISVLYNPTGADRIAAIQRPAKSADDLKGVVSSVFNAVKEQGDQALIDFTSRYDGVALKSLSIEQSTITAAIAKLDSALKESIEQAYLNIKSFHESQQLKSDKIITSPGVTCWREYRAIEAVGLYIPGGTAPLFSTALMLGVPAQIAGCEQVILCSPPDRSGGLHPAIIFAASLCGIDEIYTVGGSQAIAAMTLGTETIPRVHKIFGPGNQYVTAAKIMAQDYQVAIDLPAGPSEVLVYADSEASPDYIAADLLSQAEHGVDSQVVLVSMNENIFEKVQRSLDSQLSELPREEIARQAMANSRFVCFDELQDAFDFINEYAPEHLIILSDQYESYIPMIKNAGSVFLGHNTPESAGDYASGTNHTLPTAGYAKSYSGVSLDSFVKKVTFQHITKEGLLDLGPHIVTMAKAEQLEGHANAVTVRMNDIEKS